MINNLKNRFYSRDSVKVASNIEEILLAGICGNYEECYDLLNGIGFQTYVSVIDKEILVSEFYYMSMIINADNITSLHSLVEEVQKLDINKFWLVSMNFMNLLKNTSFLMLISISTKRVFSVLDWVEIKSHNAIDNKGINN